MQLEELLILDTDPTAELHHSFCTWFDAYPEMQLKGQAKSDGSTELFQCEYEMRWSFDNDEPLGLKPYINKPLSSRTRASAYKNTLCTFQKREKGTFGRILTNRTWFINYKIFMHC